MTTSGTDSTPRRTLPSGSASANSPTIPRPRHARSSPGRRTGLSCRSRTGRRRHERTGGDLQRISGPFPGRTPIRWGHGRRRLRPPPGPGSPASAPTRCATTCDLSGSAIGASSPCWASRASEDSGRKKAGLPLRGAPCSGKFEPDPPACWPKYPLHIPPPRRAVFA